MDKVLSFTYQGLCNAGSQMSFHSESTMALMHGCCLTLAELVRQSWIDANDIETHFLPLLLQVAIIPFLSLFSLFFMLARVAY